MQTIGERLEEARKRKGVTIREAAEATKIRGDYLQKFENNQFDIGLTDLYVRGFLKNYANYLKVPAERLVSDYGDLGHDAPKMRQPSREVYGRMEVSISGAEERAERAAGAETPGGTAPPDGSSRPQPAPIRVGRPAGSLPSQPPVNQKLIFLGLLAAGAIVAILIIVWLAKEIFGGGSPREAERPVAAMTAPAGPTMALVATAPVHLTVSQTDGTVLYSGDLQPGDRREFPDTDLLITTSDIGSMQLEFRGQRYLIGGSDVHGPRTNLRLAAMH